MSLPLEELFGRTARIVVGTQALVIGSADSGMRCTFSVQKTLKPEPNKATIKIWGLNETSRATIEAASSSIPVPVSISAGYKQASQIFLGHLREASTVTEGPDVIITIATGDGEKGYQQARVSQTFPKGTPLNAMVPAMVTAFGQYGILPGNLPTVDFRFVGGTAVFSAGFAVKGPAAWEMTQFLAACGKEWSIQDGAIQVLDKRKPLLGQAILLQSSSGLIGSPSVNSKGELRAEILITPDVYPGRLLVMNAKHVRGNFRVEKCTYRGDTHGDDWTIAIEGKKL